MEIFTIAMKELLLIILAAIFLSSCGTATKAYRLVNPHDINRKELSEMPPDVVSRKHGFKLVVRDYGGMSKNWWSSYIDNLYDEYAACMREELGMDPRKDILNDVKIVVTEDGNFRCDYHGGLCNGEYDARLNTIFVARKAFGRTDMFIPLLRHEWSHANGTLRTDHANLDELIVCTKY